MIETNQYMGFNRIIIILLPINIAPLPQDQLLSTVEVQRSINHDATLKQYIHAQQVIVIVQ